MDILINGLALPKKGHCTIVAVFSDGSVDYRDREEMAFHRTKAVALPHHGRLCDLDSLIEHETYNIEQALFDADEVLEDLKNTPVIVEANNGN